MWMFNLLLAQISYHIIMALTYSQSRQWRYRHTTRKHNHHQELSILQLVSTAGAHTSHR